MGKRVMIFENDIGILEVTTEILLLAGYEVSAIRDERMIAEKILTEKPDIILVDFVKPGEQLLKIINAVKGLKRLNSVFNIPVILFSTHYGLQSVAQQVSADGFVSKPYESDQLVELLDSFVNKQTIRAKMK